jgi:hypothetical protein
LYDLFIKAYEEYQREDFLRMFWFLCCSYSSYTQNFYERQFESRSKVYNKVVADFYKDLDWYFGKDNVDIDTFPRLLILQIEPIFLSIILEMSLNTLQDNPQ